MKIIFLGINTLNNFNAECLKNLQSIVSEFNTYIVLDIAARIQYNKTIKHFKEYNLFNRIIDFIFDICDVDIQKFIDIYNIKSNNYVVISDENTVHGFAPKFVKCDKNTGLNNHIKDRVMKLLNI